MPERMEMKFLQLRHFFLAERQAIPTVLGSSREPSDRRHTKEIAFLRLPLLPRKVRPHRGEEAAECTGIGRNTMRKLVEWGKLPVLKVGRKTNYHIHLDFSERRLITEPDVKIASRSAFFDETGKHVRTKKEITGEDGQIRKGCTVIKKARYTKAICLPPKTHALKEEPFLQEIKEMYTELINRHIADPEQHLKSV